MTRQRRPRFKGNGHDMLKHSLTEMYERMVWLADRVPEGIDLTTDHDAQDHALNLWAIEEEWILDEDLREELSLLQCTDEE